MEHIEIAANGMEFDALAAGPEQGELVVLLHGFPQSSATWAPQVRSLAEAGYRAVAPDQRGYSPGARPETIDAYRIDDLVGDVAAIADALDADRFHLVGHDWGALVTWFAAAALKDRLLTATPISSPHPLALADALADPDGDQSTRMGYVDMFRAEGSETDMLADDAAGLRLLYEMSGLAADEAEPYLEVLSTPAALGSALNWYRANDFAVPPPISPITTPTMYVWSTDDPALGPGAAHAAGDHVDGPYRFEALEGIDHWVPDHASERVTALLLEHLASISA